VGAGLDEVLLSVEEYAVLCNVFHEVRRQMNEGDVLAPPRFFACHVTVNFLHVEHSELLHRD
jgi:hypothetical protein